MLSASDSSVSFSFSEGKIYISGGQNALAHVSQEISKRLFFFSNISTGTQKRPLLLFHLVPLQRVEHFNTVDDKHTPPPQKKGSVSLWLLVSAALL